MSTSLRKQSGGTLATTNAGLAPSPSADPSENLTSASTLNSNNKPEPSKWASSEAYFFNQGGNIAFFSIVLALDICMCVWGVWEFTAPQFETDSDTLRVTLPIARVGGRLVTFNAALLLLSGCKLLWTWMRKTPLAFGFPIDNVMPTYHRLIALTILVSGCVIHTIPQIVNYATGALSLENPNRPVWFDRAHPLQLFITGILLFVTFAAFFLPTLQKIRRTATGFRLFWITHMIGIAAAIPLLTLHGTRRGEPIFFYFTIGPVVIYLLDSLLRRYLVAKFKAKVVSFHPFEDGDDQVVHLVVQNDSFKYSPGQYAEIQVSSISREWHPFTIATAPDTNGNVGFYIKASGRWTTALCELAGGPSETDGVRTTSLQSIQVRGPFGAPAQNYLSFKRVIVIGSGIGVTPLLSIWKYLVTSDLASEDTASSPKPSRKQERTVHRMTTEQDMDRVNVNFVDIQTFAGRKLRSFRSKVAYWSSMLESMTFNILHFQAFLSLETSIFCVWLLRPDSAALFQTIVAAVALVFFGTKFTTSLFVYGCRYTVSFIFLIEFIILLLDAAAFTTAIAAMQSNEDGAITVSFVCFGGVLVVHMIRIFHIFYATARPPSMDESTGSLLLENGVLNDDRDGGKVRSITAIWVSRKFSSMAFASDDLVDSVRGLISSAFSLQLYATRDVKEDVAQVDPFRNCGPQHALHAGRPDWDTILDEALEQAHVGEADDNASVGVFFCGSPAIASTLQRVGQTVTAEHQHYYKCKCRILVHKENF